MSQLINKHSFRRVRNEHLEICAYEFYCVRLYTCSTQNHLAHDAKFDFGELSKI